MKKKSIIWVCVCILAGAGLWAQTKAKPIGMPLTADRLVVRPWVKTLLMHNWSNGVTGFSAMVVVKRGSSAGPVIRNARVEVNGVMLPFTASTQSYFRGIGTVSPGNKVSVRVRTRTGEVVKGWVRCGPAARITRPPAGATVSVGGRLRPHLRRRLVEWAFSDGNTYLVVFKILKSQTELFSTDVNGSRYFLNLAAMGVSVVPGDVIEARVISPWSDIHEYVGAASGSEGHYFSSAWVPLRVIK